MFAECQFGVHRLISRMPAYQPHGLPNLNKQWDTKNMKKLLLQTLLASALTASFGVHASQIVVTFEDLGNMAITDGYGGISGWNEAGNYRDNTYATGAQGTYSFQGFNTAPNDGIGLDDFSGGLHFDSGPVVFDGAYYAETGIPDGLFGGILLYYQGQLVHQIAAPAAQNSNTLNLEWVSSGYGGLVDTLYFASGYDGYQIDNLTYSTPSTVPEPNAGLMMLTGLGLMGLVLQRRRVKSVSDRQFVLEQ